MVFEIDLSSFHIGEGAVVVVVALVACRNRQLEVCFSIAQVIQGMEEMD
jgi:hypothetical protein